MLRKIWIIQKLQKRKAINSYMINWFVWKVLLDFWKIYLAHLVDWFPFKFPFQLNQPYELNKVFKIINTGGPQIVLILCSQGNVLLQKSYYLIGDWFSTKVAIYDFCIFKVPFFSSFSIIKVLFFSYLTQKSMHSWLLSKVWNIIHSTQPTYLYFQQRKSP